MEWTAVLFVHNNYKNKKNKSSYRTPPTHLVDADPLADDERELHSHELGGDGRGESESLALSQRRPGGVDALQLQGVAVVVRAGCDDEGVDRPGRVITLAEP